CRSRFERAPAETPTRAAYAASFPRCGRRSARSRPGLQFVRRRASTSPDRRRISWQCLDILRRSEPCWFPGRPRQRRFVRQCRSIETVARARQAPASDRFPSQRISRLRLASRHIATPYRRPPDDRSQLALPRRRPALVCYRERKRSPDQTGRFPPTTDRSEEHTSELQSRENLVCRLLLEKKNR